MFHPGTAPSGGRRHWQRCCIPEQCPAAAAAGWRDCGLPAGSPEGRAKQRASHPFPSPAPERWLWRYLVCHSGKLERVALEGGPERSVDGCFSVHRINRGVPTAFAAACLGVTQPVVTGLRLWHALLGLTPRCVTARLRGREVCTSRHGPASMRSRCCATPTPTCGGVLAPTLGAKTTGVLPVLFAHHARRAMAGLPCPDGMYTRCAICIRRFVHV